MTKYQVHPEHQKRAGLVQVVNGRAVNLLGKTITRTVPAKSEFGVPVEKTIPGATQSDLKAVYEMGTKDVKGRLIVVPVEEPQAAAAKKDK